MTNTAEAVLARATAWLNYTEGPNNDTIPGQWYGLNHQPWCDMWVSKVADEAGAADVVGHFAYCPSHVNWFKSRSQWASKYANPQPGWVIFYDWDGDGVADHVGYVVRPTGTASAPALAIEGNSGNTNTSDGIGVFYHQRNIQYILGFGTPAYAPSGATNTPPPTPLTNWDGHSFPGAQYFGPGQSGPWITFLGQQMFRIGLGGHYSQGPGPSWGPADQAAYANWQRFCGYTGADANGIPGPESWAKMLAAPDGAVPPQRPFISVVWLIQAMDHDGRSNVPTGGVIDDAHRQNTIVVERALAAEGLLDSSLVDGSFGTSTKTAYAAWQVRCGYTGSGADGIPGLASLTTLGNKYGFDCHY